MPSVTSNSKNISLFDLTDNRERKGTFCDYHHLDTQNVLNSLQGIIKCISKSNSITMVIYVASSK